MNIENMTHYQLNKGENLDIDGRNLYNYIHNSLKEVTDITIIDSGKATIENMYNMFGFMPNAVNIDLSNMNTSNVTDMTQMFGGSKLGMIALGCNNLINVSNFNTCNVINMRNMFKSCRNLTSVPNFNTSKVTDMTGMFEDCRNLTSVPNFNTSNVTKMWRMFNNCNSLTTVPNFNTSKVTDIEEMFDDCSNLTSVPNFDTSNVVTMAFMFEDCEHLVDVPQLNTSKITGMGSIFEHCNRLSNESIQNIVNMCLNSNVTGSNYMNLSNINSYSPLFDTIFDNSYYQNRWDELTAAGWSY